MTENVIRRLLPDGAKDGGMQPMGYVSADTVSGGTAEERGHLFFTNKAGNVRAGVWECTPCTEHMTDYPFDQCCFVLEGTCTITDESGHAETFKPGDAFAIPRGFNGDWYMPERYKNYFITVEPEE
ncbi:MAG: cupin domain-containing protein [Rhodospirillales bacterium]|nr:cupin domain-containing protein [Rhodospirillales bacterium]